MNRWIIAMAAAVALVFVACGDDGDNDPDGASTPGAQPTSSQGGTVSQSYSAEPAMTIDQDKRYFATIKMDIGDIKLELFPKDAPHHVNNFVFLARENYYPDRRIKTGLNPDGSLVSQGPLPITRELLARGQNRYAITCGACHGAVGDGDSMVAPNMAVAPPPTFHSEKLRRKPDGYLFQVISEGYGVMPRYSAQLSFEDRWAVVAYVRALQLSQNRPLASAPADIQQKLLSEAPQ